jgi:hypothetical protein
MGVELIELVSRDETNCGRVWPWSKKRYLWQLRLDGALVVVEVQCSWRSGKCRVSVDGGVVRYGSLVGLKEYEYEFFHLELPLSVKIAGHAADLLVDGVPADYFTQTMRTQQESLLQTIRPASTNLNTDFSPFVEESTSDEVPISAKKPLLYN